MIAAIPFFVGAVIYNTVIMRAQKMHGSDIQALLVSQGGGSSGLSREQQVLGRAQLLDEREKELEAREAQQADLATRYHPVYSTRVLK